MDNMVSVEYHVTAPAEETKSSKIPSVSIWRVFENYVELNAWLNKIQPKHAFRQEYMVKTPSPAPYYRTQSGYSSKTSVQIKKKRFTKASRNPYSINKF